MSSGSSSSAAAAFPVPVSTNNQLWVVGDTATLQTSGGAVAGNGDLTGEWQDQSGNARHPGALTTARPTLVTGAINGKSVLRGAGAAKMATPSFLDSSYDTAWAWWVVHNPPTAGSIKVIGGATGANLIPSYEPSNGDPTHLIRWYTGAGTPTAQYSPSWGTSGPRVDFFGYDGTKKYYGQNGAEVQLATTGNLGISGAFYLFDISGGGFSWNGDIALTGLWKGVPSAPNRATIWAAILAYYAIASAAHTRVVFDGNSLTSGVNSTGGLTYPAQCLTTLGSAFAGVNVGVSGQTTAQMIADGVAQVDPYAVFTHYDGAATKTIVVGWEGTNSLFFGASAATTIGDLQTYYLARKSAGYKVVAATVLPRQDGGVPGTFEVNRALVNVWLRDPTRIGVEFDVLADVAADSRLSDPTNTTYFSTDKVHLTNTGYGVAASIVATAIGTL